MKVYPYSPALNALLAAPPEKGRNRHNWLFRVAAKLQAARWRPEKIREALVLICEEMDWPDRLKDVEDTLTTLSKKPPGAAHGDPLSIKWPVPNDDARRARFAFPPLFDPEKGLDLTTSVVLPCLFDLNDLVCVGWSEYNYSTAPVSEVLPRAATAPFIVANPMSALTAPNGSARSKANASPRLKRRFLVVEFDTHDARAQQAAVLSSLHTQDAPLVLAVWSGGKSIHGWFDVSGVDPGLALSLFRFAVWLGADESLFDMAKLVRMPGGRRASGERQPVLYFNPRKGAKQ